MNGDNLSDNDESLGLKRWIAMVGSRGAAGAHSDWLCVALETEKKMAMAPWWRRLGRLCSGSWESADRESALKLSELAVSMELVALLAATVKADTAEGVAGACASLAQMAPKHAAAEAARLAIVHVLGGSEVFPELPPEPGRAEPIEASCYEFARKVALGQRDIAVEENLVGAFADIANWMAQTGWCDWPPQRREAESEARELSRTVPEKAIERAARRL